MIKKGRGMTIGASATVGISGGYGVGATAVGIVSNAAVEAANAIGASI